MIFSMTGYGTSSCQKDDTVVSIEIRTVNHRFLDLNVRIPREYAYLEPDVYQTVRSFLRRGRVDVSVTIRETAGPELSINPELVRGYLEAARRIRNEFDLQDSLDLKTLLTLPGVFRDKDMTAGRQKPGDDLLAMLRQSMNEAIQEVVRMRRQEGEALESEMLRHLGSIGEKAKSIREMAGSVLQDYRQRLEERLAQLLPNHGIDPQRLAQEVALLAEKSDISEELTRLESHLKQYAELVKAGREVGKKLDFLLQEMQREANTILSKSGNLEITRIGIAVKADIEKLREQVQNVE